MGRVRIVLHRWTACVLLAHFLAAPVAHGDDRSDHEVLGSLTAFEIAVSVHVADPMDDAGLAGLSAADLAEHVQRRFETSFPGVPYRSGSAAPASEQASPQDGQLSCRVWFDGRRTPAVFQVRCQISSAGRTNIANDGSFGYGPAERAPDIIRRQIDHILEGFALSYFRAKEGK